LDLNRIAVFARVVEGSFTAAAAALGVRKSSVSWSVAALEKASDPALQRTAAGCSPTRVPRTTLARDALRHRGGAKSRLVGGDGGTRGRTHPPRWISPATSRR
jgi:DNA-binding transcriptional LysR family regulator